MLTDSTTNNIRTLGWKTAKGNDCKLHIYLVEKKYSLEIYSAGRKLSILESSHYLEAIVALINIVMTEQKNSKYYKDLLNNASGLGQSELDKFFNNLGKGGFWR